VIAIRIMGIAMAVFLTTLLLVQLDHKITSSPIAQTQESSPTPSKSTQPLKSRTENVENTRFARVGESTRSAEENSIFLEENGNPLDREQMPPLFPMPPPEDGNRLRFDLPDTLTNPVLDPALQSHDYKNVPQVPEPTPGLLLWLGLCSLIQFQRTRPLSSLKYK